MSQVVEHLAELTGFRDRDLLDVTLVSAFGDLLRPTCVAIYRAVGEAGGQHWLTRARLQLGDSAPTADPLWSELEDLPRVASHPWRQRCLELRLPLTAADHDPVLSLFPLLTDREVVGVLEVQTPQALSDEQMRLVTSVLRVY